MIVHYTHSSIPMMPLTALLGSVAAPLRAGDREEAAWIERAVRGDETAYRWLLGRYRGHVVRLARATLAGGSSEAAEDAAQEAFVKAFRSLRQYRSTGSFYGWLCRIAVRVCLDKRRLRCLAVSPLADSNRVNNISICEDCSESVLTTLVVRDLLTQLTPPMRAALVLREMDGLEYDEIAAALSIPVGTVRSRLNAARSQFRLLWEGAARDEITCEADLR